MPRVIGTHGKVVDFEVRGVAVVMARLKRANIEVKDGADLGVVQAGALIEEEVKESVAGRRAERRNVDTGRLNNDIKFKKTGYAEGVISAQGKGYPEGSNTKEVATLLEFGVQGRLPQPHFRNTEKRNRGKVKEKIEIVINRALL